MIRPDLVIQIVQNIMSLEKIYTKNLNLTYSLPISEILCDHYQLFKSLNLRDLIFKYSNAIHC